MDVVKGLVAASLNIIGEFFDQDLSNSMLV